jgi:4a-hydroxytetrahydrobiopterin dehydratase
MHTENAENAAPDAPLQPLSVREIDMALRDLPGWSRQEGGLRRRVRRRDFRDAVAFVNQLVDIAEEVNHHPDIDIRYRNVILFLTTHEVGGITTLDLDVAKRINELG